LAWHKDQNQQQTTYGYDSMWRIKSMTYPSAGGGVSYTYDDTPGSLYVEIQHTIDSTRSTNEFIFFDGLGRQISQSRANDETSNPPYDKIDTCYDALGSKSFVSFPYQTSSYNGSPNCSGSGDTYAYDGLRRVTAVTHSTGGTITTSYDGPATSVTDEGNGITTTQKISQVDGLGRLTSVCEVTGSNLTGVTGSVAPCSLDIGGTGFLTTYQYDALGNLLAVNQGGLPQRQFTYDSLSRLITASNPETGTTCYGTWSGSSCVNGYDVDSNLIQRTRPAPNGASGYVTTTYSYDALHRLLSTQYSDGTTPSASYEYDLSSMWNQTLQYPIGRLSYESAANGSAQSVLSYDNMGRVLNRWECTPQNCSQSGNFPLSFGYDYLGDMISLNNGVGTTLTYSFNRAQRITNLASNYTANGNPETMFSQAAYNAFGSPTAASLGNGVTEGYLYTPRGWLQSVTDEGPGVIVQQATPGKGSITVNGSEKNYQTGTPGTGWVKVSGDTQYYVTDNCKYPVPPCPTDVYDYGYVEITVDGFTAKANFSNQYNTATTLATALASALNASNSPVTATSSSNEVLITAKGFGSSTDYSLSVSWTYDTEHFTQPSYTETTSGSTLTGGTTTTVYDTGSVTATVDNGDTSTKSYGSSSSGSALASALASALNGSLVTATASGSIINITSVATGSDTNYPLSASSDSSDPSHFSPPSFTLSPSGASLTGGADAVTQSGPVYTLTVGYANNGDVISANDSVNGNWTYTYTDSAHTDRLNRLMSSSCASNSTALCPDQESSQAFTYTYDRFGNRWTQTVTAGEGPQPQYTFSNSNNNRIDGYSYDAAGNILNDSFHSYTYDAENRIITVDGGMIYTYDAEGRRVNKTGGASLDYLFDPAGRQIVEVAGGVWDRAEVYVGGRHLATYNGGTTYFHNADWIGTERVRTNLAGTIAESCQSLPFGDGQVCNGGDFSPMHFTGKPRDTESSLDDFPARYYSSTQGRWISADWSGTPEAVPYAKLGEPQTLNLYAYVGNNPVTDGDPSGHYRLNGEAQAELACSQQVAAACEPGDQGPQQEQSQEPGDNTRDKQGGSSAGSTGIGKSLIKGYKWYQFFSKWKNRVRDANQLKSEEEADRAMFDIANKSILNQQVLGSHPQFVEIFQLERQNLVLDAGRQAGKAMGVVPAPPGFDELGESVFNYYGRQRDANNQRIDQLVQEMASSQ
jgi:RHS repeat-associated protein